jgi:hypothetical protein
MFSLFLAMKIFCLCVLVILCYSATARYVEKKEFEEALEAAVEIGLDLEQVIGNIVKSLKSGNKVKSDFTVQFVNKALKKYPGWSVAIVHKAKTKGKAIHQHVEVPLAIGTYGYEVYFAKPGQRFDIWRIGDGGTINWAYGGNWKRDGKSNHIWIE